MKTEIIHATSSPHAMPAEKNNRRFTVFNDGIDATEVQERLDWKALRDMITIDTSILDFMPTGQHQVAALANLGAELVQEVKAYRPEFAWKSSPAEIVGALIEEMAAPAIEAKPQLAPGEREEFDAWFGDTSKRGYVHNEVSALSGWLAAKRAALAAACKENKEHVVLPAQKPFMFGIMGPDGSAYFDENCVSDDAGLVEHEVKCLNDPHDAGYSVVPLYRHPAQPVAMPDGWCQFVDGVKTQNVVRNEKELADLKEMMKVLGRPGAVEYRPFYFAAPAAQNAAAAFARQLIDSGAENYIGQAFDTECGDIEVTARYTFGKTPAEKLSELEVTISAAQADAKDAERYRWLTEIHGLRYSPPGGKAIADIGEMNAAIDTSISAEKAGTK